MYRRKVTNAGKNLLVFLVYVKINALTAIILYFQHSERGTSLSKRTAREARQNLGAVQTDFHCSDSKHAETRVTKSAKLSETLLQSTSSRNVSSREGKNTCWTLSSRVLLGLLTLVCSHAPSSVPCSSMPLSSTPFAIASSVLSSNVPQPILALKHRCPARVSRPSRCSPAR